MVVTGANSGLGHATAHALAQRGATVVMACRDTDRAARAATWIRERVVNARLEIERLDLADLRSIELFAEHVAKRHPQLDGLCNNAGVLALPRSETKDGFEMQLGINHLGHFALTGRLLPVLLRARDARVVTVASHMHRFGRIHLDDLHARRSYRPWAAYANSKLANLLFCFEFDRRLRAGGHSLISAAAHPGYASTELQTKGPRLHGASWRERFFEAANAYVGQSAAMGALPQLYAMAAPAVRGGQYFGPCGWLEMAGPPCVVRASRRAHDTGLARRFWERSAQLTGVEFGVL